MTEIVNVKNLSKSYKDICAVDNISFQVETGQLYGFLGVNGAGKSTTIHILCTLFPKDYGDISICGYKLGMENEAIRRHIGVVFQENSLDDRLTIYENLMLRGSFYYKDRILIHKNIMNVCEILGIGDLLKRRFHKLSGGQKRRCEIAKSLMNTPDLLFLDEPTTGLDPQTRQNLWDTIHTLQQERNMTVFLTTHYMEEAAKAHVVSILDSGKIVANGTPSQLKEIYACDQIKLYPKDIEEIIGSLQNSPYTWKQRNNHICMNVPDTLTGLKLLNEMQDKLYSCEVIQGSMDDVFLNITGHLL